jgi:hypothetical protein
VADEQQPDWHVVVDEHELTHRCAPHDDAPPAQSPSALQPHCPPPVTAMHR